MKPLSKYFKEDDILCIHLGKKIDNSKELKNVNVLVDFDEEGNAVGVEINGFSEALKESQKLIDRLFVKLEKDGGKE